MRFGLFELDLRAGELRKGGRKIRLQEQPLQILAMLLARPGEVVTREQIRQRLWSNDTTVEFDHSINAAIKRLRDALGDSAERPRFVETLPRRGYRCIAAVESSESSTAPAAPRSPVSAPAATRSGRHVPVALSATAAVAGLLAVAAAIWIGLTHTTTPAGASSPITVPLTGNSGIETLPSFSPDGQQVAYAWDRATGSDLDIYVKLIGGGPPLRLTDGDADEYSPTWSPDGRQIAFLRRSTEGAGIFVIPAFGGPEHKLGELSARWFPAGIWYGKLSCLRTEDSWRWLTESQRRVSKASPC
jgi:DNA-binding winged helix-turn-helix (wHTH) protein